MGINNFAVFSPLQMLVSVALDQQPQPCLGTTVITQHDEVRNCARKGAFLSLLVSAHQ